MVRQRTVGKRMDDNFYIHMSAIDTLPLEVPKDKDRSLSSQKRAIEAFGLARRVYPRECEHVNLIKFAPNYVTFIASLNWDSCTEPYLDYYVQVHDRTDGRVEYKDLRNRETRQIYHQKWTFVKDDYPGFNVAEHKQWVQYYENHPGIIGEGGLSQKTPGWKNHIGNEPYWKENVLSVVLKSSRKKPITHKRKK